MKDSVTTDPLACSWQLDSYEDSWHTTCGQAFCFNDGGPTDNGMKFCPYCGKPLVQLEGDLMDGEDDDE